jgi:hypothetical protein
MLIVGGIVFFALHKFGPNHANKIVETTDAKPSIDNCLPATIQLHRRLQPKVDKGICSQGQPIKNLIEQSPGLVTGVSKMLLWEVFPGDSTNEQSIAVCKCYI